MGRLVFYLLLAVIFLVPLVYTPGWLPFAFDEQYLIKLTVAQIAVILALLILAVRFFRDGLIKINLTCLFIPLAAFLVFNLLSVFSSVSRVISIEMFYRMITYSVLFFLSANFLSGKDEFSAALSVWKLSMTVVAIFALAQFLSGHEPYSTIGNRNFMASFVVMTMPFVFVQTGESLKLKKYVSAVANISLLTLLAFALFVARSRGGVLALCVLTFLYIEVLLFSKGKKLAGLLFILTVVVSMTFFCATARFIEEIKGDVRPYLWTGAFKMIMSAPFAGCGLGNFFIKFPIFRPAEYFLLAKSADVTYHAHNEFLNIWAETGLFGHLAFVILIIFLIDRFVAYRKRVERTGVLGGVFFGVIGVLIQSCFDMSLSIPSVAVFFWMAMGMVSGYVDRGPYLNIEYFAGKKLLRGISAVFLVSLLLAGGYFSCVKPAVAQYYFGKGTDARCAGDWGRAIANYNRGLKYSPCNFDIRFKLAYVYAHAGNIGSAIDEYNEVIKTVPHFARADMNLALIYGMKGDFAAALEHVREWLGLNPYDIEGHKVAADIYIKLGDRKQAEIEQKIVLELERAKESQKEK